MKHEQNYRILDPTKIGMTRDIIDAIDRASLMQSGIPFLDLASDQPFNAYGLVRDAYESQPHDKPPMPEAGVLPRLDVFSVTKFTGLRGLIRAIRSQPIEEATHYATIVFNGGDDGTLQHVNSISAQEGIVTPLQQPDDFSDNNLSKAA